MNAEVRFRDFYRAWLLGDKTTADRLHAGLADGEFRSSEDLVSAVFCVAVEQRFKDDPSADAVRAFMEEARVNFEDVDPPLKVLVGEALIRGALGDEHLLDEVDVDEFVPTQMPLTRKIVAESAQLQAKIDDLLNDAEKIAAHWEAQDGA